MLAVGGEEEPLKALALEVTVADQAIVQLAGDTDNALACAGGVGVIALRPGTTTVTVGVQGREEFSRVRVRVDVMDAAMELFPPNIGAILAGKELTIPSPTVLFSTDEFKEIQRHAWKLVPGWISWVNNDPAVLSLSQKDDGQWLLGGAGRGTTTLTVSYQHPQGLIQLDTAPISVVEGELQQVLGVWAEEQNGSRSDLYLASSESTMSFPTNNFDAGTCFKVGLKGRFVDQVTQIAVTVDIAENGIKWQASGSIQEDPSGGFCATDSGEALLTGCMGELCATGGFTVFAEDHWATIKAEVLSDDAIKSIDLPGAKNVYCMPLGVTITSKDGSAVDITASPFVFWEGSIKDSDFPMMFKLFHEGMPCFEAYWSLEDSPALATLSACYLDFDFCADSQGLTLVSDNQR